MRVFSQLGKTDTRQENPKAYLIRTAVNLWIDRMCRSAREQAAMALERADAGTADLPADTIGSLIIHNVANLTPSNQQRLLEWLSNQDRRRSVIATSIEPFYRNVETGLFSDGLYYRLNTVTSCWIGNPIPATPGTRPSRLLKNL
jgi:Sigma-54 interaction domain